ncbi:MAG TPA: hypothetical protein EYH02_05925 [Ignisphaera aggregans]|uniref:Uncharacterized protein n=1 Tax=Ignisphaera aggregans TaxID=334771 RepID=A0A833DVK6_9CREN|nr:hypothetical protein [Ignisphaera aggregans]
MGVVTNTSIIKYSSELRYKDLKSALKICNEVVHEIINRIEFSNRNSEVVAVPPLTHLSLEVLMTRSILPTGFVLYIERPGPSNPYDIELFLDDVYELLCLDHEMEGSIVAIYDPFVFGDIIVKYIPVVWIPNELTKLLRTYSQNVIPVMLCKEWELYRIDTSTYLQLGVYGFLSNSTELIEPRAEVEEGFRYHGIPWYRLRSVVDTLRDRASALADVTLCPCIESFFTNLPSSPLEFIERQLHVSRSEDIIVIEIGSQFFLDLLTKGVSYVWIPRGSSLFLSALFYALRNSGKVFRQGILVVSDDIFRELGYFVPRSVTLGTWLWTLRSVVQELRLVPIYKYRRRYRHRLTKLINYVTEVRARLLNFIATHSIN